MIKIGINGIGRIGRNILKLVIKEKNIKVVFLNDPKLNCKSLNYLLLNENCFNKKYLSKVNQVKLLNYSKLPLDYFKEIDVLIDSSFGKINFKRIINYNPKIKIITTYFYDKNSDKIIFGFNDKNFVFKNNIISGLTCDTVAILPILKIFLEHQIEFISILSVHPVLSNQQILDNLYLENNKNNYFDLANYVSFFDNIIPRKTSIDSIISKVIPELKNKINSYQLRIPVKNVTAAIITINTKNNFSKGSILRKIQNNKYILINDDLKTSKDFIGVNKSSIIDLRYFIVDKNRISLLVWYDNEIGYACRILDILKKVM